MTKDGQFLRMKCNYIHQKDDMICSDNQKIMLHVTLELLYDKGYVYSDVRRSNILLDQENDKAYFIDFDLCDKVDTEYPENYNHSEIVEHHQEARAKKKRAKDHDKYSLATVINCLSLNS